MKTLLAYLRDFLSPLPNEFSSQTVVPRSENLEPTAVEIQRFRLEVDRNKGHNLVAAIDKGTGNELLVTVTHKWQPNPYDLRKQAATGLWRIWATIHAPEHPDQAYIKFIDVQGNWVGGSGAIGSQIEVTKDE